MSAMGDHVLDNPIWSSLTTLHREHTRGNEIALRMPPEVAPFLAVASQGVEVPPELVAGDDELVLIGPAPAPPPGRELVDLGVLVQMICDAPLDATEGPAIVELVDPAPVLELTALVYPHYFRPRTMALGRYFGIVLEGRLAAMAGERLGMPGFREISAVCTHPDFVGRGYARRLLAFLANDLLARGQTPFLHVSPSNTRALELYETNGWRVRARPRFWSLR
jgi:ribosomal protein S18 acetylase RimI-like enzyme